MTPSNPQTMKVQRQVFDLDSMENVTLFKTPAFAPISSVAELNARLGNDAAAILSVINDGLRAKVQRDAANDTSIPWQVENEDGTLESFTGTAADQKQVNTLVLTIAKTSFGYDKDASIEVRRAAKQSALDAIKSTSFLVDGLKKSAATAAE